MTGHFTSYKIRASDSVFPPRLAGRHIGSRLGPLGSRLN